MGLSASSEILKGRVQTVIEALDYAIMYSDEDHHGNASVKNERRSECRELGLALIEDVFGKDHRLYESFMEYTAGFGIDGFKSALGTMRAVQRIVGDNWLARARALITEEVFSDHLDLADHLLQEGFPSPAVVMAMGSLEVHLRHLAAKFSIPTETTDKGGYTRPRAAEALNADLKAKGAYGTSEHKQIGAYMDVRKFAAHGQPDKVNPDTVPLMLQWTRIFISQHPA